MKYRSLVLLFLFCCAGSSLSQADTTASTPRQRVAERACSAIAGHVGVAAGPPVFLLSYPSEKNTGDSPLKSAAFTYDNAVAVIALIACNRLPQALRVGDAIRAAAFTGTRLRNAYRAGPVKGGVMPNGWWDPKANRWLEDSHQFGTATGNVAWAGLAMLALGNATGDRQWRDAAEHLAQWIVDNASGNTDTPGFTGGVDGFGDHPEKLRWKSTEHNIDAAALFTWLAHGPGSDKWQTAAHSANRFLDEQWDATTGHFRVGTLPDGRENVGMSALDVQMWAQLLPSARSRWRRAIRYADANFRVAGGFDFNNDRDGLWLEGTAQAALVYRMLGDGAQAKPLFVSISGQFDVRGYVFAAREPRITTGLALGPNSPAADFYYFHRPHLGATAWAALAALGWNPFVAHSR